MRLLFLLLISISEIVVAQTEFKLSVTDIVGLEELQREFTVFEKTLSEKTGYTFKLFPVTNRTIVVEALKFKQADFVLTGPAEYVVLRKRSEAIPLVGLKRPDYYSAIIVKADSGINSIADLRGKKIALGEIGSTSYHLAPLKILHDNGLKVPDDFQQLNVSKQIAWESLKKGQVSAIGMRKEQYELFLSNEKQFTAKDFKILAQGEELPADLIVAGKHVPAEAIAKVKQAIVENSDTLIKAILTGQRNKKYDGMHFFGDINDAQYNQVREMYALAGYPEYSEFIGE